MIKETKILKETIETHKYCGKDLCEKCIAYEEPVMGDYRTVYCKRCWDIGNDYRPKIEYFEKEEDKLYDEWITKCKDEK